MKLFLIVREDLSIAQQAVQTIHAAMEYQVVQPESAKDWYDKSNTIAFLSIQDEQKLKALLDRARDQGVPSVGFHEPDRNDELTAIALGPEAKRLCRGLKVALRP